MPILTADGSPTNRAPTLITLTDGKKPRTLTVDVWRKILRLQRETAAEGFRTTFTCKDCGDLIIMTVPSPNSPRLSCRCTTLDRPMMLVKRVDCRCHCCEHPISAMSEQALHDAQLEHATYIAATVDPTTDSHFEEARRDALLAS